MKSGISSVFLISMLFTGIFGGSINGVHGQSTLYNESLSGQEIILEKTLQINILLVGDTWSSSEISEIKNKLRSSFEPIIVSIDKKAGIRYNYQYNFLSASEKDSNDLFSFMKENSTTTKIFRSWTIALDWWSEIEHPELKDVDYTRFDAEKVEEYIYTKLIADDPNLNKPNSANLVFISDSLDKVDYLHNYYVENADKSTKTAHAAVGLMGYGGNHNMYFFDLYAVPWVDIDFKNLKWDVPTFMQNLHDCTESSCLVDIVSFHVKSALLHIITPSYLYPVDYNSHYVLDLVFYSQPSMRIGLTPQEAKYFLNVNAIKSEFEYLFPYSTWEIQLSFEKRQTGGISYVFKKELEQAQFPVDYDYGGFTLTTNLINSSKIQPYLISWASERHPTNNDKQNAITDSSRTIPLLISVSNVPVYLDEYGVLGFAPGLLNDPGKSCCALGISDEKDVWDNKIGLSSLVLHETGHTLGLAHPFDGWDGKKSAYDKNTYWNWYASPMTYAFPPSGCGIVYQLVYGYICGMGSSSFTEFEREQIASATLVSLIKRTQDNLDLYKKSQDYNSNVVADIKSNIEKAKEKFRFGDTLSKDGAIAYALKAAKESDSLIGNVSDTPTKIESAISSPFGTMLLSHTEVPLKTHSTTEITISGKVNGYMSGQSVVITVSKPDGISYELKTIAGSDGKYSTKIIVDKTFSLGQYKIQAEYINEKSPPLSFNVVEESKFVPKQESTIKPDVKVEKVPNWIKNNAKWWSQKQIGDADFVSGIQYLIKEKIVNIPNLPQSSEASEQKVPDWIRNNAGWWADGLITEDDFVKGIEYLVKIGIIKIQ